MRDGFVLRHLRAGIFDRVDGTIHTPIALAPNPSFVSARRRCSGGYTRAAAATSRRRAIRRADSIRFRHRFERTRLERQVALQKADGLDLDGRQRRELRIALRFVGITASFELPERRQRAHGLATGLAAENLDRAIETERRRR